MPNKIFIATSIDGYIADREGKLDWLQIIPNPQQNDMGYEKFMQQVDALVMGRKTFETVCSFDIEWPYPKPVFVLSNTLKEILADLKDKVSVVTGNIRKIVEDLNKKGFHSLYIDGGVTIQNFLKEDLIDEITITTIPVILGGGTPLFSETKNLLRFKLIKAEVFLNEIVQVNYKRLY